MPSPTAYIKAFELLQEDENVDSIIRGGHAAEHDRPLELAEKLAAANKGKKPFAHRGSLGGEEVLAARRG